MKLAPNFALPNQSGNIVERDSFLGHWLVLYFYPKDNTPGCTKEACDFTEGLADFEELSCKVVGISPDSPQSHRAFIDKYALGIELLSDADKAVAKAYGAWGEKTLYGKKSEGLIRSTFIINPLGQVAAEWKAVKVRVKKASGEVRHVDNVRDKLVELQNKQ